MFNFLLCNHIKPTVFELLHTPQHKLYFLFPLFRPPYVKEMKRAKKWFVRDGTNNSTAATRKERLREQQKRAERSLAAQSDVLLGEMLCLCNAGEPAPPSRTLSAYECADTYDHNIPPQYPYPPQQPYDYAAVSRRHRHHATQDTFCNGDIISRGFNEMFNEPQQQQEQQRGSYKEDIQSICPRKVGPSSMKSKQHSAAWDVSLQDAPLQDCEVVRPKFVPFVPSRGLFGFVETDERKLEHVAALIEQEKQDHVDAMRARAEERAAEHSIRREECLAQLRLRTRHSFEKALVRGEPHAVRKLEEVLAARLEADTANTLGRTCRPAADAQRKYPTLNGVDDPQEWTQRLLALMRDSTVASVTERMASEMCPTSPPDKRVYGMGILHPAPPKAEKRRDKYVLF